jgi:regulator of RNase E activity RraA
LHSCDAIILNQGERRATCSGDVSRKLRDNNVETDMAERQRPPVPELIAGFRSAATALISDNLSRLPGAVGLRPFHRMDGAMAGTALTVRTRPGDNLALHQALERIKPGEVLVVDGGGDVSRALFGEIMINIALHRKAAGVVIDGAIRDAGSIAQQSAMPCFARAACHRGPYKDGPGQINVPVSIGGMVVQPGDIVVGDDDGVVAFDVSSAAELLAAVRAQEAREVEIIKSIHEGRYAGSYAKKA